MAAVSAVDCKLRIAQPPTPAPSISPPPPPPRLPPDGRVPLSFQSFRRRLLDTSPPPPFPLPSPSLHRRCRMATDTPAAVAGPGAAYKLLLSCPAGLPRSRVSVKFHPSFDRIPHPDSSLEESIDEIWNQRLQENPSLYSGTKFRYGGHASHHNDEPNQEYSVSLHLGLTDYRTFVGTNLSPLWENFLVPSEDDSVCCQHMSNPLGNGAIVETSDEKIIVLQRSNNVGESPGYYVFPGGHSEPEEVGILAHQNDVEDVGRLIERVSDEMFDGIIREVVEETGVPASSLTAPIFIGVSRRELNVRPAAFFFIRCNVDSSTVTELYSRAQDGYESTRLYAVSAEELREMRQRLPGCHQGGFALYELMRNAAKKL